MKKGEINSTEIARLAGVSRSTVSRVINNYSNVPAETREKVMKVIQEHNYFPNVSAQVLAGKKTRTIGLFLIGHDKVSGDILTNMLISSVIENASRAGYYVLTNILRNAKDEHAATSVKEIFFQQRIDGGIFIGADNREPLIEELIAAGFIVAIVDQHLPGHAEPNRIVVNFDNRTGTQLAVDYLAGLGHTDIGLITGNMKRYSGPSKYEAFLDAMAARGLSVNPSWIVPGDFHEAAGYRALQSLLAQRIELPTAIIAANDSVAFGAIKALKEGGLQVPHDMSIIGFDDHALSAMHEPALTTVKVDFTEMMDHLTGSLIRTIERGDNGNRTFTVATSLVVRDSCRAQ